MRVETNRLLLRGARADRDQILQEVDWLNDPEVVKYSEQRHKRHTFGSQYDYIRSFRWPDMLWEIHIKKPDTFIGTLSVYVDANNRLADMGILIGDRSAWGNGYASEAWSAAMKFTFTFAPIKMITAGCMDCNYGMCRVAEKNGMSLTGNQIGRFLFEDKRANALYYGITR